MGFWSSFKQNVGEAVWQARLQREKEDRRSAEQACLLREQRAEQSGLFIVRHKATAEDNITLDTFNDIYKHVDNHGRVISNNTPGDTMAVPLSANFNYRVVTGLGNVEAIRTPAQPSRRFGDYERDISHGGWEAVTIRSKNIRVYAIIDNRSKAAFLRFDKGRPTDLIALQRAMKASSRHQFP